MTVTTEALRELVDSYDAAVLPPLSSVLVRCLELPAELAIGEVAENYRGQPPHLALLRTALNRAAPHSAGSAG
jgi:hypothetical protein